MKEFQNTFHSQQSQFAIANYSHPSICAEFNKNIDSFYASGCSIIILLNGRRHCSWQTHEWNGTTVKAHHSENQDAKLMGLVVLCSSST